MSNRSRRLALGLLSLVLLVLLLLVGSLAREDLAAVATWAGLDTGGRASPVQADDLAAVPAPAELLVPEGAKEASLHVWVRDLRVARYTQSVPPIPFAQVWPTVGEEGWDLARLDDLRTPAEIQALSRGGFGYDFDGAGPAVAAAREEGFLGEAPDLTTPEGALVSVYAAWTEMELRWDQEWEAFQAAHVPETDTWATIGPRGRAELKKHEDYPVQDVARLQRLADEVLARWPDHPVSDHALFALVRTEMPWGVDKALWDGEAAAGYLDAIAAPTVKEAAALQATKSGSFGSASPDLLDELAEVEPSSPENDLRLATWAMNRAVDLEDWARARQWSEHLRATLDAECSAPEPPYWADCDGRRYELRDVEGRLIALGLAEPRTWQDALTAAAWRCHLEVEHHGTSRTRATWTGARWHFEPWDVPTGATDCLDQLGVTEVVPEEPTRVRLTLEGP